MKIVFLTHYFPPEGNAPASRTYEHCKLWVEAGNEVTVITCAPNVPKGIVYEGYKNRFVPQRETIDGIEVLRTWTYLAANAGAFKRIVNYISYLISSLFTFLFFCKRPDLIVATSPQFFCGWAGVFASWMKWCPFVLEIRDIWPESIVTVGALKRNSLAVRVLETLEKWMYRSANHIVTVGNGYRENILKKVDVENRSSVVTNGVDINVFSPQEPSIEFHQKHDLANKFVCSYVGTIGMAHGLSVIVRAATLLKADNRTDIAFCVVGDGAQRAQLEQEVADANVGELVKIVGRLPKEDMPMVLASSDCLLIHLKKTDLFETVIPSKIFEAMAMERPLIMGVQGESADIVRDSGAGIQIESDNESQLVEAVTGLCDDRAVHREFCLSGRQFVSQNYSRDQLAMKMLDTLNEVVSDHATKANPSQ